jgi:AcrR family transcriptional regulator
LYLNKNNIKEGNMQGSPEKRNQIIKAAAQLFHRFGYGKTSLDDIAREAGLGKGTIYYYFESKEDIFFEVAKFHAEEFYNLLLKSIAEQDNFKDKFSLAIRLPIKLVYEHTPIFIDAIKNLPRNYLHKVDEFRIANKQRMIDILKGVMSYGYEEKIITEEITSEKIVQVIFDWFLLGDSNIIIKHPEEFIRKAEQDYEFVIQLILYGIIKRGK